MRLFRYVLIGIMLPAFVLAQSKKNIQYIHLSQFLNDTIPFLSPMRITKKIADTSLTLANQKPDSFFLYRTTIIDNTSISNPEENKLVSYTYFLVNKGDTNKIVFDTDSDQDFKDEPVYDRQKTNEFIKINHLSFYVGNMATKRAMLFKPAMSEIIINGEFRRRLGLGAEPVYRYGNLILPNKTYYKIAAFNMFENQYTLKNTSIVFTPNKNKFPNAKALPVSYKVGDTVYLSNRLIVLKTISENGDSLGYIDLGKSSNIGIEEGKNILPLSFRDIFTGRLNKLGSGNDYVLIDFWGTWCKPCIELFPSINLLKDKYKLQAINIAYDNSVDKVRDFVTSNKLIGVNGFDDAANSVLCAQLKIRDFPTLILLDPKGKIILRVVGKDGFEKLKHYLNNLKINLAIQK